MITPRNGARIDEREDGTNMVAENNEREENQP